MMSFRNPTRLQSSCSPRTDIGKNPAASTSSGDQKRSIDRSQATKTAAVLLVEELQQQQKQQQLLPSYLPTTSQRRRPRHRVYSSSSSIFLQELARFLAKKDATKLVRSVWEVARSLDRWQHHPQHRSEDDSILVATREREKLSTNERVFCLAAV